MRALFVLSLRQMLGGKKIWILALFLSLPVLLLAAVLAASGFAFLEDDGVEEAEELALSAFLYIMYPQTLCILSTAIPCPWHRIVDLPGH